MLLIEKLKHNQLRSKKKNLAVTLLLRPPPKKTKIAKVTPEKYHNLPAKPLPLAKKINNSLGAAVIGRTAQAKQKKALQELETNCHAINIQSKRQHANTTKKRGEDII